MASSPPPSPALTAPVTQYLDAHAQDPFDAVDFDVIDVINELCPDESHLSTLPLLQIILRQRIQECRQRTAILRAELEATTSSDDPTTNPEVRVARIQEGIGALLTTLATIRSSSTESQSVVESITRDIRSLDLAKANLESAVVGLRRFGMLVNAFDQLTKVAKDRRYREVASALQAVKSLAAQLSDISATVPRVSALFKGVHDIQGLLRSTIMNEFSKAFAEGTIRSSRSELSQACLVVDTLGDDARCSLIEWYTTLHLREYRRVFSASSEAGQLDNLARRFAWFRRILKSHEEDPNSGGSIFPNEWKVGVSLCGQFGEITRQDLKSVLVKLSKNLTVNLLLESLQSTVAFEREMSTKFNMPYEAIAATSKTTRVGGSSPISVVYEAYLGIYVDAQDRTLAEMIQSFRSSRPTVATFAHATNTEERPASVIPSSTSLFYFYRETLDRCAQLSNKTIFLDLCHVYKKWLKIYSEDILTSSLKTISTGVGGIGGGSERQSFEGGGGRKSNEDGQSNLPEVLCACAILNTADYCADTAGQLQERLREKIHVDFKDKVSLEAEQDFFRSTISIALQALLREVEVSCEPAFLAMVKSPWKDAQHVTTESLYVADLTRAIKCVVDLVKIHLEQKKYIRSFCDKIVGLIVLKFTNTLVRSRPIQPIGAEQLIHDLQTLKNCLISLPQITIDNSTPSSSSSIPTSYSRYIVKTVGKLDTLLKAVMACEDEADEFVKAYLVLIPCQSFSDFQKLLDLKGVKRSDQNHLLDVFLSKTSTMPDLSDSSILSGIDLDADKHGQSSGTGTPTMLQSGLFSTGLGFATLPLTSGLNNNNNSDHSRVHTPVPPLKNMDHSLFGNESGRSLSEFRRFGQKLGMGLRFSRDTKGGDGSGGL